jgi:hypothetical protein
MGGFIRELLDAVDPHKERIHEAVQRLVSKPRFRLESTFAVKHRLVGLPPAPSTEFPIMASALTSTSF